VFTPLPSWTLPSIPPRFTSVVGPPLPSIIGYASPSIEPAIWRAPLGKSQR
jgi:hypothetical protein